MSRTQAEDILNRVNKIGSYLVRKCKSDDSNIPAYAVSFW